MDRDIKEKSLLDQHFDEASTGICFRLLLDLGVYVYIYILILDMYIYIYILLSKEV